MYRRLALREFMTKASLKQIYQQAVRRSDGEAGDKEFARYQRETVENIFTGARFDFVAISAISVDESLNPGGISSVLLDLSDKILDNYADVAQFDCMAPLIYLNPGRALSHEISRTHEEWLEDPFFRNHCRIFDIHRALMIAFAYPGKDRTFITFEYLGSADNPGWALIDQSSMELVSLPFAFAWLYRKGILDESRLSRYFAALAGLTPTQVQHLRKYVSSPYQSLREQAADLGNTEGAYKRSLYDIRDSVAHKFDWTGLDGADQRRISLRAIDFDYGFLRIMGDPTRPLIQ